VSKSLYKIEKTYNETALKVIFGSFNIFIFSCIKIYHNKNNKKMSGKSNIKVSDLNIPAAEEEKQNR
ncbi:hypothetical protein, partial [Enterococcus faecium]|uniref:hypothetical protein n=2 Tax=Enterococcus faecium TaxID=1352 RepID=UPI00003DA929